MRRSLAAGEPDHERTWLLVGLATILAWLLAEAVLLPAMRVAGVACPWKAITGWPCLTCGATRALRALGAGAFATAFRLNPLVTLTAVLWVVWTAQAAVTWTFGLRRWRVSWADADLTAMRWTAAVSVAASWGFLLADGR
jgi:hypothetical protein